MENKYYDLIISLIKKHRKYPLYEDILENIAQDVYDHARVIIESVQNEEVIISYLNKIVSTSIVTVPKRLNYHTRLKNRTSYRQTTRPAYEPYPRYEAPKPQIVEPVEEKIIEEEKTLIQEPVKEVIEQEVVLEQTTEEPLTEQQEELSLEEFALEPETATEEATGLLIEEPVLEPVEEASEITEQENVIEETEILETASSETNELLEEPVLEEITAIEEIAEEQEDEEPSVNMDLVDKMINGVNSEETEDLIAAQEEDLNTELELTAEEPVESLLEEISPVQDTQELELAEESFEAEPAELPLETVTEEILEPEVAIDSSIEELPMSLEENSLEEALSFEPLSAEDSLESLDSLEEIIVTPALSATQEPKEFAIPNYACFNYNPSSIEDSSDISYISSELDDLAKKLPEQKIKQIFDLKYNQKMTIHQIAESLNFTEEAVITSLNEIIEIVKD